MNTSPNSSMPAGLQKLAAAVALLKRSVALSGRILAPVPAMGEVLMVGLAIAAGLSLGVVANRARAAEPAPMLAAGDRVLQSHAFVTDAPSFEIEQMKVEKMTPFAGGKAIATCREHTERAIMHVVNGAPMTTEMITKDANGLALRLIRRGDGVVMKLGDEPWQLLSGPYFQLKEQLGTPYACPLPDRGPDSPQWQFASVAQEQGQTCDVIETVGDSCVGYVAGIMNKSLNAASADPAKRPSVKVESYVSRQWIARLDARRLRVEQAGHIQVTMHQPTGQTVEFELETTGTTLYRRYGEVTTEIPAEAERLLAAFGDRPRA